MCPEEINFDPWISELLMYRGVYANYRRDFQLACMTEGSTMYGPKEINSTLGSLNS